MRHEERTLRAEADSPYVSGETDALWDIAKTLAVIADMLMTMQGEDGTLRISQPRTRQDNPDWTKIF